MKRSKYSNELVTEFVIADKILAGKNVKNGELLLEDTPRQAALGVSRLCTIEENGYILLDFGEELHGGVDVTVQETEGRDVRLRIVFGESVMEALSSIGEKNATNDHSFRDMMVPVTRYSTFRAGQTGFRFVKLEACGGAVHLGGVRAAFIYRDLEYRGSFESDDVMLNQIWRVGARTVHLNMQEYIWDGIKRDRLVWIGDMHAEISAIAAVFGYQQVVDKSLDLIRDITPPEQWMNGIPSYTFWWLIIQRDWYFYTGRLRYLHESADYIFRVTQNILKHIAEDGNEHFFSKDTEEKEDGIRSYFVDWETNGSEEAKNGFYSVMIMALEAAQELCGLLNNSSLAVKCGHALALLRAYWLPQPENRQIAALMVLAGRADAVQMDAEILSKEAVDDITTFLGYYTLLAKGMAGNVQGAVTIIKKYWGRMIELGATSFWESFRLTDADGAPGIDRILMPGEKDIHGDFGAYCYKQRRCSLCHGWACGPTPFLSKYVLGIRSLEAGCKKLLVRPQLASLRYAKGSFPTPYGTVTVTAEKTDGKVDTEVKAPPEVEIVR